MSDAAALLNRFESVLLPYLFGAIAPEDLPTRARGKGSRNATFLRYLLMWTMRFAFRVEEHVLAGLFGKNRCTVADACDAVENARLSDSWDAIFGEVSEWLQKGEQIRARILEAQADKTEDAIERKGWRASRLAECFGRAGAAMAPKAHDDEDAILEVETSLAARRLDRDRLKDQRRDSAAAQSAGIKAQIAAATEPMRTKESKARLGTISEVVRRVLARPDIQAAIGRVPLASAPPETFCAHAQPVAPLKSGPAGVRLIIPNGKPALDKAHTALVEAFRDEGYSALGYGVFGVPGRANGASAYYRLTPLPKPEAKPAPAQKTKQRRQPRPRAPSPIFQPQPFCEAAA